MLKLPKKIAESKINIILAAGLIIVVLLGYFTYQKFIANKQQEVVVEETDLSFDPEGPYALLYPRRDGNALVLNLKRTASYDKISYELAYTSQPDNTTSNSKKSDGEENTAGTIDRGVMGELNTKDKKGEYEQEILFGTCSKNVCKYDKGVENGTLTLHIKKGNRAYRIVTLWHLQKPYIVLGKLISGDGHLVYQTNPSANLSLVDYSIINDLSGAPKLPSDKTILGKVYSVNAPVAKSMPEATVTLELSDIPVENAKIARFDDSSNKWIEVDTKIDGNKLIAKLNNAGIITVLSPKK